MKIYDKFSKLLECDNIWVYSDPHFDDQDCKNINEQWPSSQAQVKMINSKVGKNDALIILGDIGNAEWVKKLKGYKVLVMGNHDKGSSNYKRIKTYEDITGTETINELKDKFPFFKGKEKNYDSPVTVSYAYCDNGLFDEVYEGPLFIGDKILLSHEPIDIRFGVNIHGHCHGSEQSISRACEWAHVNVCSDVIGWTPVRLDKIVDSFKTNTIHRLTIDGAIDRKCPINDVNCLERCVVK